MLFYCLELEEKGSEGICNVWLNIRWFPVHRLQKKSLKTIFPPLTILLLLFNLIIVFNFGIFISFSRFFFLMFLFCIFSTQPSHTREDKSFKLSFLSVFTIFLFTLFPITLFPLNFQSLVGSNSFSTQSFRALSCSLLS